MKYIILAILAWGSFRLQAQFSIQLDSIRNMYGVVDNTGKTVIPFEYYEVFEGLTDQFIARKCNATNDNCLTGVIDRYNKVVIPLAYDDVFVSGDLYRLHEGCDFDPLFYECFDGTIGYADKTGKLRVPIIYDNTYEGIWADLFSFSPTTRYYASNPNENLINVRMNSRWGYVDYDGKVVIPFQFDEASYFLRDSALVKKNGTEYFINKSGQCIQNCPDQLDLTTSAQAQDQSANYQKMINGMMKFYLDEKGKYAGKEYIKREQKLYSDLQPVMTDIITFGDPQQQKLAKYMYCVLNLNVAVSLDTVDRAYPYLNRVKNLFDEFRESDFPLAFEYNGGKRNYSADNYRSEYALFYNLLSECEYILKMGKAEQDLRKSIELSRDTLNKTISTAFLIDYKQELGHYDREILDLSTKLLFSYEKMNPVQRHYLDSLKKFDTNQPAAVEPQFLAKSGAEVPLSFYIQNYPVYKRMDKKDNAHYFMQKAYEKGADDLPFLNDYASELKERRNTSTGKEVTDKINIKTSATDCQGLQNIADLYMAFNEMDTAKDMKKKADECVKNAQRAEEKRQKQSSRSSSSSYSYSGGGDPGIFFGVEVFPLLRLDNSKRDYGFKMDIIGRKTAHEFHYKIHNNDRDYMWDLAGNDEVESHEKMYWNGYTASYALKFFGEKSGNSVFFVGPMLRYREKDFGSIDTLAYNKDNLGDFGMVKFQPFEKQYEVLVNYGYQTITPGFASEIFIGFGAKYSVFDIGNPAFNNSQYIVSHSLIEGRAKDRWGLAFRIGLNIGFKIF